jgi:hypothetical protein
VTALYLAAEHGHADIVNVLLMNEADTQIYSATVVCTYVAIAFVACVHSAEVIVGVADRLVPLQ